ncbi:hypothetical protein Tco_1371050 [Tanacetum coccineum]
MTSSLKRSVKFEWGDKQRSMRSIIEAEVVLVHNPGFARRAKMLCISMFDQGVWALVVQRGKVVFRFEDLEALSFGNVYGVSLDHKWCLDLCLKVKIPKSETIDLWYNRVPQWDSTRADRENISKVSIRDAKAHDRQKSYADLKRKPMEFEVGDKEMAPKRTTRASPATTTTTTTSVTNAQLQAMIDQGVTVVLAARDATRNGNDSHTSAMGVRRNESVVRECTYQDFMKCQTLYFKGTEGFVELTQWFGQGGALRGGIQRYDVVMRLHMQ